MDVHKSGPQDLMGLEGRAAHICFHRLAQHLPTDFGFIYRQPRPAIDGLSLMVADHLARDVFSGGLYVLCNRGRTIIMILYWDRNGFCLWQKRLEKHRFHWPETPDEVMALSHLELGRLLEGLNPLEVKGHPRLTYSTLF